MAEEPHAGITELIAQREKEIAFLRALQEAESNPALKALALKSLGASADNAGTTRRTSTPAPGTAAERILAYLGTRDGKPESIVAIAAATGCSESAARQVLYRTHKDRFEKSQDPSGRKMLFKLA